VSAMVIFAHAVSDRLVDEESHSYFFIRLIWLIFTWLAAWGVASVAASDATNGTATSAASATTTLSAATALASTAGGATTASWVTAQNDPLNTCDKVDGCVKGIKPIALNHAFFVFAETCGHIAPLKLPQRSRQQ
jgi:hypothetical protein